jgi:hypothetical protein
MEQWVIAAIEEQARASRSGTRAQGPTFPLHVFAALRAGRPDVIEYIEWHKPEVDPYQVVACYIPNQG